jgi:hypothetical protein
MEPSKWVYGGANDGARTRDNQNHNLGLYQLSYVRHRRFKIIAFKAKEGQKNLSITGLGGL